MRKQPQQQQPEPEEVEEKKPKAEWTRAAVLQLSGAGVLAILSLVLSWIAFSNWRLKSNLLEGYQSYSTGSLSAVRPALQAALDSRPEHIGARELLAKVLCDQGKAEEAAVHYKVLRRNGHDSAAVKVGMGVVALKAADALTVPKDVEAKVREAISEFRAAGDVPEAQIGLGHAELVLAQKLGDDTRYAAARAIFDRVRGAMDSRREFRASITRDGLVDYYSGLGKALASGGTYDPGASAAFRACSQYARRWVMPLANVIALESRRLSQIEPGSEDFAKVPREFTDLRNEVKARSNADAVAREGLKKAWLDYSFSLARLWGRANNWTEYQNVLRDIQSDPGSQGQIAPNLMDCEVRTGAATREEPNASVADRNVGTALQAYLELRKKMEGEGANAELKARALNNLAWMQAWRGGYQKSDVSHKQALESLIEALKLAPEDYVYNRNAALVLKRLKKPAAEFQPYVEKARSAVGTQWADDFSKLQQYLEGK